MTPERKIEDMIRNARTTTSASTDERIIALGESAIAQRNNKQTAIHTGSGVMRIIVNGNWTKLATAAAIIIAIGLGMYALTGSVTGTSITMAQVRQAMQEINWLHVVGTSQEESFSIWYSFAAKAQIIIDNEGKIVYFDFKAGKRLIWNPGNEVIYESDIEEGRKFAGGVDDIFGALTESLSEWEAEGKYKVTRELGTYKGQKVEIWNAQRIKGEPRLTRTEKATFYIDVVTKLPLAATDVKGAYGGIQHTNHGEFEYPGSGPADIYEAGAPKSARIVPAPGK
jgi:hypothetical protein